MYQQFYLFVHADVNSATSVVKSTATFATDFTTTVTPVESSSLNNSKSNSSQFVLIVVLSIALGVFALISATIITILVVRRICYKKSDNKNNE